MLTMPSRRRMRHAIVALRSDGAGCASISLMSLSASQQRSTRLAHLVIDGRTDAAITGDLKGFLSALAGANLCHFGQQEVCSIIDRALLRDGLSPIDNPIIDLCVVAQSALIRRGLPDTSLTVSELAARHGTSLELARQADVCPVTAVSILADLFKAFFLPELISPEGIYAPAEPAARFSVAPDDICALAGDAGPCPALPGSSSKPENGWRRHPWSTDEAIDCALRYSRGATLEALATLTRRSPRAIRARLALDGIIARPVQHTAPQTTTA